MSNFFSFLFKYNTMHAGRSIAFVDIPKVVWEWATYVDGSLEYSIQ
jgi:hypothetical protein